mmetsp:Transcript_53708/g.114078  ORF Transcript_53708/g.114078 Transcript_53708/m.114078 type:complete len:170 (+) Transcript_53708:82-591(+)|eukprot:CAMPEP_0172547668 /NCGR_PEP_ID=MMETSP1067-20121228/17141_1 /TAXON_ID=265564 ORGANISM="Thalassiosira punctigera, Strain Tpunct2005C2" /NCGR_SAMPLE_ID=MMETSP1067 /ASSEMBLY_ACC=CAM_ASM_000444 /LENGTH=169 /DNA_ID=CAMNT_0013334785 /DNA_START=72 /DNA_END=581 /DNA_ORIENTATION=+
MRRPQNGCCLKADTKERTWKGGPQMAKVPMPTRKSQDREKDTEGRAKAAGQKPNGRQQRRKLKRQNCEANAARPPRKGPGHENDKEGPTPRYQGRPKKAKDARLQCRRGTAKALGLKPSADTKGWHCESDAERPKPCGRTSKPETKGRDPKDDAARMALKGRSCKPVRP